MATPLCDRPVADTASRTPAETSSPPARTLGSILPGLGRRLGMRPSAAAVRAPVRRLEQFSARHGIAAALRTSHVCRILPADDRERLVRAAHVAHMARDEEIAWDGHGNQRLDVRLMSGGMQDMRDVGQAFSSVGQSVGQLFNANHEAAVLVAKAIEEAHATGRHAIKDGKLGYDYAGPRGIAVTLDHAQQPRKSQMERMTGLGFRPPGLAWLKLGLSAHDRTRRLPHGETEQRPR